MEVEQFKAVWDDLQSRVTAAIERDRQTTANTSALVGAGSDEGIFGMSYLTVGLITFGVLFILRR